MKIYEEVDRNLHDLEKSHEELKVQSRSDKDIIRSLNATVDVLESRCSELQSQVTLMEEEQLRRKRETRRASSVPSLVSRGRQLGNKSAEVIYGNEYEGFPTSENFFFQNTELSKASNKIQILETQINKEQKRSELLMDEIKVLTKENHALEDKLSTVELNAQRIQMLEWQVDTLQNEKEAANRLCKTCGVSLLPGVGVLGVTTSDLAIEHDDLKEIKHGEVIKLKSGGSVYGSRESLNQLGLEAEDDLSMAETCAEIAALGEVVSPIIAASKQDSSPSLLGELEEQYRSLVRRYEYLVEMKSQQMDEDVTPVKRPVSSNEEDTPRKELQCEQSERAGEEVGSGKRPDQLELQPKVNPLDLKSPVDPIVGHFENGPPQYKVLFKEIFETLRRSINYEEEEGKTKHTTVNEKTACKELFKE